MLICGWLLGGTVGLGTLVYALCIGPLAQVFLPLFATHDPATECVRIGHHLLGWGQM